MGYVERREGYIPMNTLHIYEYIQHPANYKQAYTTHYQPVTRRLPIQWMYSIYSMGMACLLNSSRFYKSMKLKVKLKSSYQSWQDSKVTACQTVRKAETQKYKIMFKRIAEYDALHKSIMVASFKYVVSIYASATGLVAWRWCTYWRSHCISVKRLKHQRSRHLFRRKEDDGIHFIILLLDCKSCPGSHRSMCLLRISSQLANHSLVG